MIWETNSHIIIMLTNLVESGREKAHLYWPSVNTSKQYGKIYVNCVQEDDSMGFCIKRKFKVSERIGGLKAATTYNSDDSDARTIIQYHYTVWPDHGVPDDKETVLELIEEMDERIARKNLEGTPIVVHCSAGIGRTGTYVMIHTYMHYIMENGITDQEDLVIENTLSRMRDQRPGFVQRKGQYAMVYKSLKLFIEHRNNIIDEDASSISDDRSQGIKRPRKNSSDHESQEHPTKRKRNSVTVDSSDEEQPKIIKKKRKPRQIPIISTVSPEEDVPKRKSRKKSRRRND
eukprot:TRINITY_DN583_c0_g1_i1.p1 TRINITY_DN583_c0_g1~~TRINITY_DN583_c0_g1_i1.p1  ORF type:complete len:289 (+),score=69.72 TRINITY_DN583_c0_g1_i1:537-1403(+)